VTFFLPILGIGSGLREPAVNRDRLFDVTAAGPLAALLASALLYMAGEFMTVQSTLPAHGAAAFGSFLAVGQVSPGVIQRAIDSLTSGLVSSAAAGPVRLSPMEDAATAGFMLSFMSLFPLVGFDGGHLFTAAFGGRATRLASYVGALALICLDTPRYWAVAVVVILLTARPQEARFRDEVSELSAGRKALLMAAIVLAVLSIPIPGNLAAFPLG
jgi:membrane-associated protease RseP (regulator of RpoE activity)